MRPKLIRCFVPHTSAWLVALLACQGAPRADTATPRSDELAPRTAGRANGVPPAPAYDDKGIHVSPKGSDSGGDGSPGKPYKTIGWVLDKVAKAGDTLILRGGEYPEKVRVKLPRITIRSHSGEWAVISQPANVDDKNPRVVVTFDPEADGGKLQRVEIRGGFYGVMTQTMWSWGGKDRSGAENITVEDAVIHGTGRDGIKVTPACDGFTVRRTEIYNTGMGYPPGTKKGDKNAEGIDLVNADRALIQDCYIHDTATTGVYLKGGAIGGVVERTRVERAGSMGIALGFDTSTEFFDVEANPGYYENIDGVVRNNIVIDANYAGIGLYATLNARVLNNTVIDTAHDGHAPLYFGVTFQDWDPVAKRPPTRNATIVNNVFVQPRAGTCVEIRFVDELGGLEGFASATMDRNVYWAPDDGCRFVDKRAGGKGVRDLASWQQRIGGDKGSRTVDPRLGPDGRPLPGSPLLGAGEVRSDVTDDIDREPRSGKNDIGADQRK